MQFENEYATYKIDDGILKVFYKNVLLDYPAALRIVNDRIPLHEGQYLPVLCDIRYIKEINKAARAYLALEGSTLIKAVAFLVESPVSKTLFEFYDKTSRPPIPMKAVATMEEGIKFLGTFKET